MNPLVVAAFPGSGKSYYSEELDQSGSSVSVEVSDLLLKYYSFNTERVNLEISEIYQKYSLFIDEKINDGYSIIFIPAFYDDVLELMRFEKYRIVLVYPKQDLLNEYLTRYKSRGSDGIYIEKISREWNDSLDKLKSIAGCRHIELNSMQYISDIIKDL